ncbi:hypothetical protein O3P69_015651 [Scylla paramamosain]|uniref:Uncharacterized protein n=1 Tax=Scylla paramamosain TaxID=85552 RepID=A0AAW0SIB2_SCYPA
MGQLRVVQGRPGGGADGADSLHHCGARKDRHSAGVTYHTSWECVGCCGRGSSREANSVKEGQQDRGRQPQRRPPKQRQEPSTKVTSEQHTPHIPPWHPIHITS